MALSTSTYRVLRGSFLLHWLAQPYASTTFEALQNTLNRPSILGQWFGFRFKHFSKYSFDICKYPVLSAMRANRDIVYTSVSSRSIAFIRNSMARLSLLCSS
uniref:Putative secreted protein n=1 Tax=Anopheles darlingi TaxID=43151 RepID=A0A2M4D513_ANODA